MKEISRIFLTAAVLVFCLAGCRVIKVEEGNKQDLEYEVVQEEALPRETKELIQQKKENEFQMVYQNEEFLYLIKGYGRQMTGGYSIRIEELSVSETAVFFSTRLMGPSQEEKKSSEPSYPYIVVKISYREEPVQFQ